MEPIVLTDKFVTPNEELVFSIIGDKSVFWKMIINYLHDNHPDISEVWKYYNDGKSWLFRTIKKKKTIFWIGVIEGTFRITFWFGDKAEPLLLNSDLPERLINDFGNAKRYGAIRPVTFTMTDSEDVECVKKLIEIKLKLK